MKSVLLTGAGGFIGRHCVMPLLDAGYTVHAVSSRPMDEMRSVSDDERLSWHHADLLDTTQARDVMNLVHPTYWLHLAWFVKAGEYWTSTANFQWVHASLQMLETFARNGGKRAVIAGTCAEYDWNYGYCREDTTPLRPRLLYGTCKNALREMGDAFAAQSTLSLAWGRIFLPYGPHEDENRFVPSIINVLLRGHSAPCTHGRQIRDLLHVQDVADAFVALLESELCGAVNIGSGRAVTLGEVALRLGTLLHRHELIDLGARAADVDEPPLLLPDVRRLHGEIGWSPRFDLDGGLRHTIDWWKKGRDIS